ncbi:AF4/FMR2 family member lilli isoform X3 [Drosophila takahashii]|uniref:AF4/FMR2 family member lilli isoform X3 n=1 Tax=Drosophila takahashii TaxID=29030 RepID=UPI001CF89D72|nr:AF4/FMR2 family member lilli [Drosophila takahashii]XP_044252044.1 AF4/FMR2 family member lilli [Drosophila takahashii]
MRLKETTKKSAPSTNNQHHHNQKIAVPLSGDLLSTLHISPPLHPHHHHQLPLSVQLQHQLQQQQQHQLHHHQQRCSSVGSTSSSGTCETDRSGSCSSALSPAGGGMMPGLGASEGLVPGGGGVGGGAAIPGAGGASSASGGQGQGQGPNDEASAAAVLAANIAESFTFLQQHAAHHFRDILYAAHMLGRGYYQPAGPLISPHVIAAPPPQAQVKKLQEEDSAAPVAGSPTQLQQHQAAAEAADQAAAAQSHSHSQSQANPTHGHAHAHGHAHNPQQAQHPPQPQPYPASAVAAAAAAAAAHQGVPYSRSMHAAQMHYSTAYPPNYYAPYPGEVMCYSPPTYQPYFSSKVYQPSHPGHPAAHPQGPPPPGAYRRYPYYQHAGPPPPHELYEQQQPPPPPVSVSTGSQQQQQPPTSSSGGAAGAGAAGAGAAGAGAPAGSQLVPAHQQQHQQQHLEHYPGPPSYYAGYSPGGGASSGQCYTRGLQGPYMEYPPQCPCPMPQSCPKNVHTGPHIGSNIISNIDQSGSKNSSSSSSGSSSSCSSNMLLSATSSSNSSTLTACSNATTTTTASALTTSRGPVKNVTPNNSDSSSNTSNSCNKNSSSSQTSETTSRATAATNTTNTTATTATTGTQCQMLVKTELKGENPNPNPNPQVTKMQYEAHVMPPPTPPESYCASDEKLLDDQEQEAELELRLRLGLRMEKGHGGQQQQQQHIEAYDLTCSTPPPVNSAPQAAAAAAAAVPRKARIGKSMAREMVYAAQQQLKQPKEGASAKMEPAEPEMPFVLKAEIKAETKIKIEHDGEAQVGSTHISDLPDLKPTIKTEPEQEQEQEQEQQPDAGVVTAVAKTEPEQQDQDQEQPTPGGSKQRINLLASSGGNKKTKTNHSYKSLIKQAEPKNYLCPGRRFIRRHGRAPAKYAKRRQMILTQRQQQRMRLQRREQQQQRRQQREAAAAAVVSSPLGEPAKETGAEPPSVTEQGATPTASPKRARPRKQEIAALHLLEGLDTTLSRGYFSDPELNHSSRKQAPTAVGGLYAASSPLAPATDHRGKQPAAEKRSKSETKKPAVGEISDSALPCKKPRKQTAGKAKGKSKKSTGGGAAATVASSTAEMQSAAVSSGASGSSQETNNNEYQTADLQAQKFRESTAETEATGTSANQQQHSDEQHQFLVPNQPAVGATAVAPTPPPPSTTPSRQNQTTHTKRARSRCKFGNRKRQRQRPGGVSYELDVTQPPATKANVVPKWNNGWMWAGTAFQGAVFLNSDDPLVLRTCYPAMRHVEGDIIRIRDCVLLKANEDNELPYVAKVAHLWQNPEDGEMMMSLLWYYRPEHTDQGRQRNDCPDEVYASRHRDHNSVACVEDKCYVLTFSEYCRYRRRLRAAEEDVEDVSIVPRRPSSAIATGFPVRTVPEHTNPELVMFCRRAYEFRTRRLLKLPQKNGLVCSSS